MLSLRRNSQIALCFSNYISSTFDNSTDNNELVPCQNNNKEEHKARLKVRMLMCFPENLAASLPAVPWACLSGTCREVRDPVECGTQ